MANLNSYINVGGNVISVTGNITAANINGPGQLKITANALANDVSSMSFDQAANTSIYGYGNVVITADSANTTREWRFQNNGLLQFPSAAQIGDPNDDGNTWLTPAFDHILGLGIDNIQSIQIDITTNGSILVSTDYNDRDNRWVFSSAGTMSFPVLTYNALPSATPIGQRVFISDSTVAAEGNFGSNAFIGGGANLVPVYSNGSDWFIG
jgi:hypothetical protein